MWTKEKLYFQDIVLIYLIKKYWDEHETFPTVNLIKRMWPEWMIEVGAVEEGYTKPIYSGNSYSAAIKAIRSLGLLEDVYHYKVSEKGEAVLRRIGDDWRYWPVEISIENGELDWENAIYYKEAR